MTTPLRKLIAAATPGPWFAGKYTDRVTATKDSDGRDSIAHIYGPQEDRDLIATLRNLATLQCDVVDAAEGRHRPGGEIVLSFALTALRTAMKEIENGK